ncbi:MAG: hypothetical protein KGI54_14860 [Pseudomonadota bacterium]|nr:hypothetical protein [Pseudomonadota bacterium]
MKYQLRLSDHGASGLEYQFYLIHPQTGVSNALPPRNLIIRFGELWDFAKVSGGIIENSPDYVWFVLDEEFNLLGIL